MDDLKDRFQSIGERISVPADAFDRFSRSLVRKERRSRFAAAAVGLAITLGLVLAGIAVFATHERGAPRPASRPTGLPANGKIAFARSHGGWHIFTINPDGTGEQQISTGARDYSSGWSPDGTKIAYDSSGGLSIMNADGSGVAKIADADSNSFPAWSPDGTKILFNSYGRRPLDSDNPHHLFTINPDGTGRQQLTTGAVDECCGSWSPDGTRIVFARYGDEAGLYVMNADGSDVKRIAAGSLEGPDWSPDGTKIVATRNISAPGSLTRYNVVMNADGSEERRLTQGDNDAHAVWSPDGTKVAFVRDEGHVWTVNADGTDATQLTASNEEDIAPSWGAAPPTMVPPTQAPVASVQAAPLAAGQYYTWETQHYLLQHVNFVDPATDPPPYVETTISQEWWGADTSGASEGKRVSLDFFTAADRQAHIAAGDVEFGASKISHEAWGAGQYPYEPSLDLPSLSSDPAVLAEQLRQQIQGQAPSNPPSPPVPLVTPGPGQDRLSGSMYRLVEEDLGYALPSLQPALFDVASNIAGMEVVRGVTDPVGRPAVLLRITTEGVLHEWYFDPNSHLWLAWVDTPVRLGSPWIVEIRMSEGIVNSTADSPAPGEGLIPEAPTVPASLELMSDPRS